MPREGIVSARKRVSAAAAVAARAVTIECLEERRLMAAVVPSGFQYGTFVSVPNMPECTSMTFAPDGRLYYTEKSGAVRVIRNGVLQSAPVVRVSTDGFAERGLESIALDPNFATNGFFYVYYTKRDPANPNVAPNNAKNRVSRFKVDLNNRDRLDTSVPEKVLIDNIASDSGFHNGGWMNFGLDG